HRAALDLTLDDDGVDRLAHIDRMHQALDGDFTGVDIDRDLGGASGPPVHRIGVALVGLVAPADARWRVVSGDLHRLAAEVVVATRRKGEVVLIESLLASKA